MGILKDQIKIFCYQKKINRDLFKKDTLLISQNAVYATEKQVFDIFNKSKLNISKVPNDINKKNKIISWKGTKKDKNINADYLMKLLGSKKTQCCDVSSYEKPDFILDLNKPVPKSMHNKFNNVVDTGTFEHVFNTPQVLDTYCKILKKKGYLVISTTCSNLIDHGFYSFSPTFFFDYFEQNGFVIKNCFLKKYSPYLFELDSKIYIYSDRGTEIPFISNKAVEIIVIAKKIKNYKKQKFPTQFVYRNMDGWKKKNKKLIKISKSKEIIKKVILFTLQYLPFSFEALFFSYLRGKNIKKLNI